MASSYQRWKAAPQMTCLIIANNDWQVSPDGNKIALVAAKGTELDGIWIIGIGQN